MNSTDSSQTERAKLESREDPRMNESGIIEMLEYHGYVQGKLLVDYGLDTATIPDPDKDYFCESTRSGVTSSKPRSVRRSEKGRLTM